MNIVKLNKNKNYTFFFFAIILFYMTFYSSICFASYFDIDNICKIEDNQKINNDIFMLNNNVTNKGIIVGDMTTITMSVINEGTVFGDLLGLFLDGYIDGVIKGDLRVVGNKINIYGEVRKNITALTKKMILNEDSIVDGSITIFGEKLEIHGLIGGDIRGKVHTLIINGEVKGDINIKADEILIGTKADVKGKLNYKNKSEIIVPKGYIKGGVFRLKNETQFIKNKLINVLEKTKWIIKFIYIIGLFISGFILIKIFPEKSKKISEKLLCNKRKLSMIGLIMIIIVPIISIILTLTIVCIPIALIILSLYCILLYFSILPASIYIGNFIIKENSNIFLQMSSGLIILFILSLIPYIGICVKCIYTILGMGVYYEEISKLLNTTANCN